MKKNEKMTKERKCVVIHQELVNGSHLYIYLKNVERKGASVDENRIGIVRLAIIW